MARLGRVQPQQGNVLGEDRVRKRFYLSNSTSPVFDPGQSLAFWDDTANAAGVPFLLTDTPTGTATSVTKAETSASGTFDVLLGQWVSKQVSNGGSVGGSGSLVVARQESDAAANLVIAVGIWVIDSTGTIRGSALTQSVGSAEFNTTATAANTTLSPTVLEVQPGDRIVVELGYRATNTDTTSYTGTLFYGGTATPDLASGDTDTSLPSFIDLEVSPAVFAGSYTTAVAENAAGTGTANSAAPDVKVNAENCAGTGTSNAAAPKVTVNAENAAGTGTCNNPAITVSDTQPAENAAGTGTANQPAASVAVAAFNAPGTGAANNTTSSVKVNADVASGTGTCNQPGLSISDTQGAEPAEGTGTCNNPAPSVKPNADVAAGTGTANSALPVVGAAAGNAAGTGAANNATTSVKVNADVASGTGTADNAFVDIDGANVFAAPGNASGTGAANQPAISVKTNAEAAAGTGAANNATAGTVVTALAEAAAGTGTANQPAASVKTNAETTTAGSGTCNNSAPSVLTPSFHSMGVGAGLMAHTPIAVNPGNAAGTGAANNATVSTVAATTASAGVAAGTGTANNATSLGDATFTTVSAEVAGGDGAALDAAVVVRSVSAGGWYTLLRILAEAREPDRRPQSCPHCGEPYRSGPNAELFCPFDGYRPQEGRRPAGVGVSGGPWSSYARRSGYGQPPGWGPVE